MRGQGTAPGDSGSVVFTTDVAGGHYYICQLVGHIQYGMCGTFNVTA